MGEYSKEIDSFVDEDESREELERQLHDEDYVKEKIQERRARDSASENSVRAIMDQDYSDSDSEMRSSYSIYKPPINFQNYVAMQKESVQLKGNKSYHTEEDNNVPVKAIKHNANTEFSFKNDQQNEPETFDSIRARIAKQMEIFHKVKNECLENCSDFMDDFESKVIDDKNKQNKKAFISIPEDFDDIVDIAVDELEERQAIGNEEEVLDEDGKPFWMRYFKADYLGETDPNYQKLLINAGIDSAEEQKVSSEDIAKLQEQLLKIKSLDKQLVNSNKLYKGMKEKSSKREQALRDKLEKEKNDKKKEQEKKKKEYIKSNTLKKSSSRASSRSKNSETSNKSSKGEKRSSKGFSTNPFTGMRRPSSGRSTTNSAKKSITNKKVEEDKSNTFLTGVAHNEKMVELDRQIRDDLDFEMKEEDEEGRSINQNDYQLDLFKAYDESMSQSSAKRKKYFNDSSSENSKDQEVDYIKENQAKLGPEHHKSYLNRLSEAQRQRLEILESEIDESYLENEET